MRGIVAMAVATGTVASACSAYGKPPPPEGPYRTEVGPDTYVDPGDGASFDLGTGASFDVGEPD